MNKMTKIGKTLSRGALRTRKIAIDSTKQGGAISKINNDSFDGFGQGKARRQAKKDAKAAGKVRAAKAPKRKERKAEKQKGTTKAKVIKAEAKKINAEKGNVKGAKVLETINKGLDTAKNVLSKGDNTQTVSETETKKDFNFLAWYMILIYLVVIGLIVYFAFIKK